MKNLLRKNPVTSFLICGAMLLPTACGRAPIDRAEAPKGVNVPIIGSSIFGEEDSTGMSALPSEFKEDESQALDALDDVDEVNQINMADSQRSVKRALPFLFKRLGRSKILERLPAPFLPPQLDRPQILKRPPGQAASVETQVIYSMADFRLSGDLSTWGNMQYYHTQNPSEAGNYFKQPLPVFRTFVSSPGAGCTAQLYKCGYFRGRGDARQFLSLDKNCRGNLINGSATNPSIGFVCTSWRPGTTRLYAWFRKESEGRVYTTQSHDQLLNDLGFEKQENTPEVYIVPLQ